MSKHYPYVDPDGLLEYSVVFTDRALNHMSRTFQQVMREISATLKRVYSAEAVIVVPGGGTYGMEAVARQFATGRKCLVLRNGWFSYRWSQIFEMGTIPAEEIVLKARPLSAARPSTSGATSGAAWQPAPIEEVIATIERERPDMVFAPHVETAAGILLPDPYLKAVADAVHAVGGLFVLDAIASGALWVDMQDLGVDILVSAPQKGWSAPPSSGLVLLGAEAARRIETTHSTSFAIDLHKWLEIMRAYENGGHAYHATLPTDALVRFRNSMLETERTGLERLRAQQWALGTRVRELLNAFGLQSVAAEGFEAPGVVVYHTTDASLPQRFAEQGIQIAAGVPLMCDEPSDFLTFRIGLFGLDKLQDVDGAVAHLVRALEAMAPPAQARPQGTG